MLRDLRLALRALRTWRWGALIAVLTLALGIGATTALYGLLRVALSENAADIEEIDRVVRIYGTNPALAIRRAQVTLDDFEIALTHVRSFESVAAYHGDEMTAGSGSDAETLSVMRVSPAFFDVMRARAVEGRLFIPADRADDAATAVVSEIAWRRRFAGRRIADIPTIRLNGREHTIVGVLPASFSFPVIGISSDVWIPLSRVRMDGASRVAVIARLRPGVTWASAAGELATLAPPLQQEGAWRWGGIPVQQDTRARTAGATVWIFLPAAVVLIVGCVNVACMLLARGFRRDTELSVRMALGATRGDIFRQLLIENSLLAAAAGVGGAALAAFGLDLVSRALIEAAPSLGAKLAGDFKLLPTAVISSAAACVMFGLVPALRLSRRDVAASLKGSGPAARVKIAGYGARDLVVFLELGLAVVLVVFTAMSFSVISVLQDMQIGFAASELVSVRIHARDAAAASERVRAVAGVSSVALISGMPGDRRPDSPASAAGGRSTTVSVVGAGEGFFETAGLPIIRGRSFATEETAAAPVVILSETAAAALWPGEDAIGRQLDVAVRGRSTRLTVVGVARDAIHRPIPRAQSRDVYRPLDITGASDVILLARASRPREIARHVGDAARPHDDGAVSQTRVLGDMKAFPAEGITVTRLFGGFALLALLLAASGIFAVVSQSVAQRTSEFGVRLALGATPRRVLWTVLGRELKLIAAALATGTVVTMTLIRSSGFDDAAFILAVTTSRPQWTVTLVGLCGAVAAIACGLATFRIVKLDPSVVLRRM